MPTAEARNRRVCPSQRRGQALLKALLGVFTLLVPAAAQVAAPPASQATPSPLANPPQVQEGGPAHHWPGEGDPMVEKVRRHIIKRESGGNYQAVDCRHRWFGAYQFQKSSSDLAARRMERPELVGVTADQWSPADQDGAFYVVYNQGRGKRFWHVGRMHHKGRKK